MQHIRGYRVLKCGQFFTVYSLETLFHLQGFATFWWANYLCADANKRFQRMLLEKWVINQNSGRILKKIDQVGPLNLWALGIQCEIGIQVGRMSNFGDQVYEVIC